MRKMRVSPHTKQSILLALQSGIFWFAWAFGVYLNVYLKQSGFTASLLGVLNAICSAVGIAAVSFWGMVSDRVKSVRKVLVLLLIIGSVLYALIPVAGATAGIMSAATWILVPAINFFRGQAPTMSENLIVRSANENRLNYGRIRALGSLLFTVGAVIITFNVNKVGYANTFWISSLLMTPVIVLVLICPEPGQNGANGETQGEANGKANGETNDKGGAKAVAKAEAKAKEKPDYAQLFKNRTYMLFLVFAFIFYICTTCEYTFIPYLMEDRGISNDLFALVSAYRALFEIPFLVLMLRIRRRFSLRSMISLVPVLMAMETMGFAFFAHNLGSMLFFCTFYGLGNGLFIGGAFNYLYEIAPDNLKATAHAYFAAVSQISSIMGNLFGGYLYDAVGSRLFYVIVGLLFLLSAVVFHLSGKTKVTGKVAEKSKTGA